MRKLHKVLIGIFVAGVFLGGIGAGVAFGEYSTLEYGGKLLLGKENLVTRDLDYSFEPSQDQTIVLEEYWGVREIIEDSSVPKGIIRYRVTYNEEMVLPELVTWDFAEQEYEYEGEYTGEYEDVEAEETEETEETEEGEDRREHKKKIMLGVQTLFINDDFDIVMKNKDKILEELKQKKIFDYDIAYITDMEVRVNPKTLPYLEYDKDRYVVR